MAKIEWVQGATAKPLDFRKLDVNQFFGHNYASGNNGDRYFEIKLEIGFTVITTLYVSPTVEMYFELSNVLEDVQRGFFIGFDWNVKYVGSAQFDGTLKISQTTLPGAAFFDIFSAANTKNFLEYVLRGNDTITAGDANDYLTGLVGNDVLNGGKGHDYLLGGVGNDRLFGGDGGDRMIGGLGNDALSGGIGRDLFIFNSLLNATTNLDLVSDFNPPDDSILLENSFFTSFAATGALNTGHFLVKGARSQDRNDYVVYDKSTGALYFDVDGVGGSSMVAFANLQNKPTLTFADFFVT